MTKKEMQQRIKELEAAVAKLNHQLASERARNQPQYYVPVQPCDPIIQIQRPQEYERPSVTCFQAVR